MPKSITNGAMEGLFRPFTQVMSKARKQLIIDTFLERKWHLSPSGYTARIITSYCVENKIKFVVFYRPEDGYKVIQQ